MTTKFEKARLHTDGPFVSPAGTKTRKPPRDVPSSGSTPRDAPYGRHWLGPRCPPRAPDGRRLPTQHPEAFLATLGNGKISG